jgi:hypothetical protein
MQRRIFLRNVLWFTGGLYAGCNKKVSLFKTKGGEVKGVVSSNGRGIANVVVSDGFDVVKTAADGSYTIKLTARSQHVFISIPSGYEIPHSNNIASHYKTVEYTDHFNFELQPLAVSDHKHQFLIWADPQVKNVKDVGKMMRQSVPDVRNFSKSLPEDTLLHGICVGDIVWDNPLLFDSYNTAIEESEVTFFQALGNHDMDYREGGDDTSDVTFKKHYGPTYYSFNRGQVHYVVLDDVFYLGKEREYKGFITENQLEWLKKDLSYISTDKLIVVCLHIPVHNKVENNSALYDILRPYNKVHIMSGHTHYNENIFTDNVYEHVHGTVCGAWWTGPICDDGTPSGYAVYEVEGTEISWYYKSVGFEKEHQVRAIIQEETGNLILTANVWNWDPEWTVEYWVDGIYKDKMPQLRAFDPLAVALYKGDQLPNPRPFVEPHKTNHLFRTIVDKSFKEIRVIAHDRFGHKYETII